MVRIALVILIAACAADAAAVDAWVDKPHMSATHDELLATSDRVEPTDGAVRLLEESRIDIDADGRTVETWRRVVQLDSAAAIERWGTLYVGYSPWHQGKPEISGRVIGPDGTEVRLDPSTIRQGGSTSSGGTLLDDRVQLQIALPNLSPGSIVEQVVVSRDTSPFLSGGASGVGTVAEAAAVGNIVVEISAPKDAPFTWALSPGTPADVQVGKLREKGRRGIVIRREDVDAVKYSDPATPAAPFKTHRVSWSTWPSWEAVEDAYIGLADPPDPRTVGDWVDQVAALPKAKRISGAIELVRDEIRYTGLEFGQRAIVAWPPGEVRKRGYGDCKDKAQLLAMVLSGVGIRAQTALVRTFPNSTVDPATPGLSQFNHMIVYVPDGPDGPLWIDATEDHATPGTIPFRLKGRRALVLGQGRGLTRIPLALDELSRWEREYNVPGTGRVRVTERQRSTGAYDTLLRNQVGGGDPVKRQEAMDELVADSWQGDGPATTTHGNPRDLSEPFALEVDFGPVGLYESNGKELVLPLHLSVTLTALPAILVETPEDDPLSTREDPLHLWPVRSESSFVVNWAPPMEVDRLPEEISIVRGPLEYRLTVEHTPDERSVRVDSTARIGNPFVSASDARAFRDDIKQMLAGIHEIHLLDPGIELSRTGRLVEAHRRYEGTQTLPVRANRVDVLRAALLPDLALAEAEALVEDFPDEKRAWQALLNVAMAHRSGRFDLTPVMARTRGIAALTRLNELDGKHAWSPMLVRELATGSDGAFPNVEGAPAALELLAAWEQAQPELSPERNTVKAQLLGAADRWEDILALPPDQSDTVGVLSHRIAALAVRDGAERGIVEARRRVPEPAQRIEVLQGATVLLMKRRRYDLALAISERTAALEADPDRARNMLEMMRLLRPFSEVVGSAPDPQTRASLEVLIAMSPLGGSDPVATKLDGLISKRLRNDLAGGDELAAVDDLTMPSMPFGTEVGRDLAASMFEAESVEGDKETGWRVHMRAPLIKSADGVYLFFVAERGKPKLRGIGSTDLGAEALWRLDKGDVEGARQWLRWAAELARRDAGGAPHSLPAGLVGFDPDGGRDGLRRSAILFAGVRAPRALLTLDDSELPPLQRAAVARARYHLHKSNDDHRLALDAIETAAALFPDQSEYAWFITAELEDLGEIDALKRRVEAWKATPAWNRWVQQEYVGALLRHEPAVGIEEARKVLAQGLGDRFIYNWLAWHGPAAGLPLDEALRHAERAAADPQASMAATHTLVVVQLASGRVNEAIATMRKVTDTYGASALESPIWSMPRAAVANCLGYSAYAGRAIEEYPEKGPDSDWFVERLLDPQICPAAP